MGHTPPARSPMRPAKWAAQVLHADRIGEFVDEAWSGTRRRKGEPPEKLIGS